MGLRMRLLFDAMSFEGWFWSNWFWLRVGGGDGYFNRSIVQWMDLVIRDRHPSGILFVAYSLGVRTLCMSAMKRS